MKASSEATDEDDRHADGGDWRCQNRGQEGGGGAGGGPPGGGPPPPGGAPKNLPIFAWHPPREVAPPCMGSLALECDRVCLVAVCV